MIYKGFYFFGECVLFELDGLGIDGNFWLVFFCRIFCVVFFFFMFRRLYGGWNV